MFGNFALKIGKQKIYSADGTVLHTPVPGFTKDQIKVQVMGPMVSVVAEIPKEGDKDRYAFREYTAEGKIRSIRYDYYFDRIIRPLEVKATLANGMLTLEVEATKQILSFDVPIQDK